MGRSDCPSVFELMVIVQNSQQRVIYESSSPVLVPPADFWENISVVIEHIQGAHELIMIVRGKDNQFWAGNFGSKVCHCSVRVLGSQDDLDEILKAGGEL